MQNTSDNASKASIEKASTERWQTWYEEFDTHHSPEARSQWYSSAAKAYHWARPRYPDSLLNKAFATLAEGASLLEIGCGPGIATTALAKRGFRVQAVEPSAAACELALESCQGYSQVSVHNSTFEDYPLADQTFDAVVAPTSFHWVSPAVACKKSAAALNPGGSLILLWATPPQPSKAVCDRLQAVYDTFDLSDLGEQQYRTRAYYQHNFETFAHTVADSGLFSLTAVDIEERHSTYSVEKYLALLSTLSPYIALEEQVSIDLFKALGKALTDELKQTESKTLVLTHWFAANIAPLRGSPSED